MEYEYGVLMHHHFAKTKFHNLHTPIIKRLVVAKYKFSRILVKSELYEGFLLIIYAYCQIIIICSCFMLSFNCTRIRHFASLY